MMGRELPSVSCVEAGRPLAGRRATRRSGVSLVETMVALAIFAAAMGAIYRLALSSSRASHHARDHYAAANIAKSRLEAGKARGHPQAMSMTETNSVVDSSGFSATDGRFRRTTTINTNVAEAIDMTVVVDVRNRRTGLFDGGAQQASLRIVKYREKPR